MKVEDFLSEYFYPSKRAYFIGLSVVPIESEKIFNYLFSKFDRYYVTKNKEILEQRTDLNGRGILSNICESKLEGVLFIPYGSSWNCSIDNPWKRYAKLTEHLFSTGTEGIVFYYLEEDANRWRIKKDLFISGIIGIICKEYLTYKIEWKTKGWKTKGRTLLGIKNVNNLH